MPEPLTLYGAPVVVVPELAGERTVMAYAVMDLRAATLTADLLDDPTNPILGHVSDAQRAGARELDAWLAKERASFDAELAAMRARLGAAPTEPPEPAGIVCTCDDEDVCRCIGDDDLDLHPEDAES